MMTGSLFEDLDGYRCTCGEDQNMQNHESNCQLWDCHAFEMGTAWWDGAIQHLRHFDDEELEELGYERSDGTEPISLFDAVDEAIGGKIETDWRGESVGSYPKVVSEDQPPAGHVIDASKRIYHDELVGKDEGIVDKVTEAVDAWLHDGGDEPTSFSYRGCTWVWDKVLCKWEAKVLGCYCGYLKQVPDALECEDCEVVRWSKSEKRWHQLTFLEGEETCNCTFTQIYRCGICHVERDEEWMPWQREKAKLVSSGTSVVKSYGTSSSWTKGGAVDSDWQSTWVQKCRHHFQEVEFPSGVKVVASSHFQRHNADDPLPDFGFYLDKIWEPQCLAFYVPWTDRGLPRLAWNRVYEGIEAIYKMAENGTIVEIGCIGGHGRTGTVLACLAVIAGVPAEEAVDWVHEHYCKEAVESYRQEWFVLWFDAKRRGIDPPKMPPDSWYGMEKKDRNAYKGESVPVYRDTKTDTRYCGKCQTDWHDLDEGEEAPATCWWCGGTFVYKKSVDEEPEQATKTYSGPRLASETKEPHITPRSEKKPKDRPTDVRLSPIPTSIGLSDAAALKEWVFDQYWPKKRLKVMLLDGIFCSNCWDHVSWRHESDGLKAGWVHRTKPGGEFIEHCQREPFQCKWNIRRNWSEAEERHAVKLIGPPERYLTTPSKGDK